MKLETANDYAIRSLVTVEILQKKLTMQTIADIYSIPRHSLIRAFTKLNELNLVDTSTGNQGGVTLKRPAERITVADIVFGIEEKFVLAPCMKNADCLLLNNCLLYTQFNAAEQAMKDELRKTTIQDLALHKPTRKIVIKRAKELGIIPRDFVDPDN